ncbi:MAG: hypothetical protein AB4062_03560 [Crocosphaera sp.]
MSVYSVILISLIYQDNLGKSQRVTSVKIQQEKNCQFFSFKSSLEGSKISNYGKLVNYNFSDISLSLRLCVSGVVPVKNSNRK